MEELPKPTSGSEWFDSAQLLLAEKRTALSVLRTGSGIFVLPLSVLSLLIATANSYQNQEVMHLLIPVLIVCGGLIILSVYLVVRALRHIYLYDRLLEELRRSNSALGKLIN